MDPKIEQVLPQTVSQWKALAETEGVLHKTLSSLDALPSASKISLKEYLAMRVLRPRRQMAIKIPVDRDLKDRAEEILKKSKAFKQNPTPSSTQDPPQDPRQLSRWEITRQATSRGQAPCLPTYWPPEIRSAEVGAPFKIPVAQAGDEEKPPGEWAKYIWEAPFSVTRRGEFLKGKLPLLLKEEPVRELMVRSRYFAGARRIDEILRNDVANVESAAVFCQGGVKTDKDRCDGYVKTLGP